MIFTALPVVIAAIYVYYLLFEEACYNYDRYKRNKDFDKKCEERLQNLYKKYGSNPNNLKK